jgi:branched-subunit amino acid transport protein
MTVWIAMLAMGVVTFALRAAFLVLPPRVKLPTLLRRALPFVPSAGLTAVWAPELLLQKGVLFLSLQNERLLAGLVAIAVSWRWRLTFATIASGLLALHLFDWLT